MDWDDASSKVVEANLAVCSVLEQPMDGVSLARPQASSQCDLRSGIVCGEPIRGAR
jgi:hypothetical protein